MNVMTEPGFKKYQYEFTAHLRDPEHNPAPEGIEDRRIGIYRDLLYNNVESFLSGTFPVLRNIHDDDGWHASLGAGDARGPFDRVVVAVPAPQAAELLEQIGEGGMGVVYMAEQREPFERRVALKIIKPGMDTRQVIDRFEAAGETDLVREDLPRLHVGLPRRLRQRRRLRRIIPGELAVRVDGEQLPRIGVGDRDEPHGSVRNDDLVGRFLDQQGVEDLGGVTPGLLQVAIQFLQHRPIRLQGRLSEAVLQRLELLFALLQRLLGGGQILLGLGDGSSGNLQTLLRIGEVGEDRQDRRGEERHQPLVEEHLGKPQGVRLCRLFRRRHVRPVAALPPVSLLLCRMSGKQDPSLACCLLGADSLGRDEIGRASCRERV